MKVIEPRFSGIAYIAGKTLNNGFPKLEAHIGSYHAVAPQYQDGVILAVREDGQHVVLEENDPDVARETQAIINKKLLGTPKQDKPSTFWPYRGWMDFAMNHIVPIGRAITRKFGPGGPWEDTDTGVGLARYTKIFPWAKQQLGTHNLERLLRESLGLSLRIYPEATRRKIYVDYTDKEAQATLKGIEADKRQQPASLLVPQAVSV